MAREGLHAAGALGDEPLWPIVAAQMERADIRAAAQRALEAGGSSALPAVATALADDPVPAVAVALLDSASRLGPDAAAVVRGRLGWALDHPDPAVGTAAVRALLRTGHRAVGNEAQVVTAAIEADLAAAEELGVDHAAIAALGDERWTLALGAACAVLRERLVAGLGPRWAVLQDPELGARVVAVLDGAAPGDQLEYAREAMESSAPRALGLRVAEVLTAPARPAHRATAPDAEGALSRLLVTGLDADPLLAGLVLHTAAVCRPALLRELIESVAARGPDAPALVRITVEHLTRGKAGGPIERVIAMHGSALLEPAGAAALVASVPLVTERTVAPDQVLFTDGDAPDHLYLVLDGEVELVHAGACRRVGPGDVVGEVGICAATPHVATAVVRKPGSVLVIPAPAVEELLANQPAVGRMLLRRLAAMARSAEAGIPATDAAMAAILDRFADPRG